MFALNKQFRFIGLNLPRKVFPAWKRKSGPHYRILHIRIGLGMKLAEIDNFIYPLEFPWLRQKIFLTKIGF